MRHVTLVGGGGYIGLRLARLLARRGWKVTVVDPMIHAPRPKLPSLDSVSFWEEDIREVLNALPSGPIVYLAGFHDVPFWGQLGRSEKRQWQSTAAEIMIDVPWSLALRGRDVIYFSSMRALTHPYTFYGGLKATAERQLFQKATILRLGTVMGGLESTGLYTRTITVPNNWILRGELPDGQWRAFVTPMRDVLFASLNSLHALSSPGQVHNVVSPAGPVGRGELELAYQGGSSRAPREPHPAIATARYYELPLP